MDKPDSKKVAFANLELLEIFQTRDDYAMTKRGTFVFAFVVAFLIVFAVHFLDFPGSVPRFTEMSRGGVLLDQTPSLNVDATYQRLADYGEEGRKSYWFRNLTVDIILPLSLLPFLFLLMLHAVRSIHLKGFARILLLCLSFAYVIFDLRRKRGGSDSLKKLPSTHEFAGDNPTVSDLG